MHHNPHLGSAGIHQNLKSKTVLSRTMTTKPHRHRQERHTYTNKQNTRSRTNVSIQLKKLMVQDKCSNEI